MEPINPDPDPSLHFLIELAQNQEFPVLQDVFRSDQKQLIDFAEWMVKNEQSNVELSSVVAICLSNDLSLRKENKDLFDRLENVIFNNIFTTSIDNQGVLIRKI